MKRKDKAKEKTKKQEEKKQEEKKRKGGLKEEKQKKKKQGKKGGPKKDADREEKPKGRTAQTPAEALRAVQSVQEEARPVRQPQASQMAARRRTASGTSGTASRAQGRELEERLLVFRALADESRLQILDLLSERERCGTELLASVPIVHSTLSHHMQTLLKAGLVTCRKQGRATYYAVDKEKYARIVASLGEKDAAGT